MAFARFQSSKTPAAATPASVLTQPPAPAPTVAAAPVAPVPPAPQPTAENIQAGIAAAQAQLDALNSGDVKQAEIIQANVAGSGGDLSTLFAENLGISSAGLMAFVGVADEPASSPLKFPVINLTSGNGAGSGSFAPADWVDKEFGAGTSALLPAGKRPFHAVLLGYRFELLAWAVAFDDPSRKKDDRPAWSCAVPANDAATVQLATEACKNYQFTKKNAKGSFDFAHSKAGHVRPALQIMVFVPDVGIVVLAPPMHYTAVERTIKSMGKLADQQTGALRPQPVLVETKSVEDKTPTQSWFQHNLDFNLSVAPEAKKAWDQFNDWRANQLPTDADMQKDIREFLNCTDKPVTDEIKKSLTVAAAL